MTEENLSLTPIVLKSRLRLSQLNLTYCLRQSYYNMLSWQRPYESNFKTKLRLQSKFYKFKSLKNNSQQILLFQKLTGARDAVNELTKILPQQLPTRMTHLRCAKRNFQRNK